MLSKSVWYFPLRTRLLFPLKDSLKISSKIKLIVKSLCWTCMYFLPQFQNNYEEIGPNCAFSRWLQHSTDLGVAWQACTTWSRSWQPWISQYLVLYHHFTIFITSLLYLVRKQILHLLLHRATTLNRSLHFLACPISFKLCCCKYIFQVLKIYVIRKKKRWVSMHKTTNAQRLEMSHFNWMKT